ncbi:MAG: ribonuclease HI family protein [Candidatus Scalindua sp.]|nr:ribonuclease HI family protein [Candidatus Scalindua sp.]
MKKTLIKDEELLTLIHKNINIKELKKLDKTVTKKRIDALFHDLANHAKEIEAPALKRIDPGVVRSPVKKFETLVINIDGASRGNPGKSGVGVAIFDKDSKLIKEICEYIGLATNNVSEYKAFILGIKEALKFNPKETLFKSDSELLVKQIKGEYRVKNPHLMYLFTDAQGLLKKLPKWKIEHIPREENRQADKLANQGIESATKDP